MIEKDLVIILISSLTDEFNYLITALETIKEDTLTWDYVRDRLIHEAEKMKGNTLVVKSNDALFTQKKFKDFKCHYCKQ